MTSSPTNGSTQINHFDKERCNVHAGTVGSNIYICIGIGARYRKIVQMNIYIEIRELQHYTLFSLWYEWDLNLGLVGYSCASWETP